MDFLRHVVLPPVKRKGTGLGGMSHPVGLWSDERWGGWCEEVMWGDRSWQNKWKMMIRRWEEEGRRRLGEGQEGRSEDIRGEEGKQEMTKNQEEEGHERRGDKRSNETSRQPPPPPTVTSHISLRSGPSCFIAQSLIAWSSVVISFHNPYPSVMPTPREGQRPPLVHWYRRTAGSRRPKVNTDQSHQKVLQISNHQRWRGLCVV